MRTILYGIWILGGLCALSSCVTACTADCESKGSCGPYIPAESGASGTAGTSAGGMSGTGDSGSAGDNGGGGRGGHSGSSGGRAGSSGTSGDSGAGGEIVPACDTTKSPSEEACLVSDEYAIFVAPSGKDSANGSKSAPVKTIAKALELAGKTKLVIGCNGSYDEQVKLTTAAQIYGGFACPGAATPWSYEAGKKAKVTPSTKGVALSIASAASSVVIEDFEFDAKDGVDASESSVAAFVSNSTSVALTRVKLVAGKGVDGANGTLTKVTGFPTQAELNGNAASGNTAGTFNLKMCPVGGSTTGGAGGNGGPGVTGGGSGAPALGGGAAGTLGASCSASPSGTGGDGANAPVTPPALGATKLGSITAAGWMGLGGGDGAPGSPGQGGGGGTGSATSGGGGGGGAGGCGGAGGTGGKAGGSSIALLLLNASPVLTASDLVAGNAGKGGSGAAGQDAQLEFGLGGNRAGAACNGGNGGVGAAGGAGGGAAGGISVGIAYQGMPDAAPPMPDATTTIVTGLAGLPGVGGVPGSNDGLAGVKQDVFQAP